MKLSTSQVKPTQANPSDYARHNPEGFFIDGCGALLIILLFTFLVEYRASHPELGHLIPRDTRGLLGAEYDSIAQAIRKGRGFADPFKVESGPTAWMTPVLPYLLAALYALCNDDRAQVVKIIVALELLSNFVTAFLSLRVARALGILPVGYIAIVVVFFCNMYWLFQRTHDVWLIMPLYNLTWFGAVRGWARPSSYLGAVSWGGLGGLAALCSPVAGLTWAVVSAVTNLGRLMSYREMNLFMVVVMTSVLAVVPWTIRNRIVLGHWIPVKSNFAYEVWQAQCLDDDGVLDSATFSLHPWAREGAERIRYLNEGEIEFVSNRWPLFWSHVSAIPSTFFQKLINRFTAATWHYETTIRSHEGLMITKLQRLLFWLPFAGLLLTVALRNPTSSITRGGDMAVLVFGCGLSVYVCFSYYQRYSAPLAGICILLMLFGLSNLCRFSKRMVVTWKHGKKSR